MSRPLDLILHLDQHDGTHPTAADQPRPDDVVDVEFRPRLRAPPPTAGVVTAHGVRVNTRTGTVTALDPPPARAVANFLIEARVTVQDPGGVRSLLPSIFIRVHVHGAIEDAWLTPSPLSIHEGAARQRFAVLGQFDDQTIGSLTEHLGSLPEHRITWVSGDPSGVVVGPDNGQLGGTVQLGGLLVPIVATLPPDLGGRTATGDVRVLDSWGGQPASLRAAHLIPGGPGSAARNEVANVLFIAEGFVAGERTVFEQVVTELVRQLRTSVATQPFNLLRDSINYWWVFLPAPSPPGGVSTLMELDLISRSSGLTGLEVDPPTQPRPTGDYTLQELVFEVGLPLPADANASFAAKRTAWGELFPVTVGRITENVFLDWRRLHDRRLANEVDSALGLCVGGRPSVELQDEGNAVGFHHLRTTRAHLDQFLATLTDGVGGTVIGHLWDARPPDPGKDRDFVVALCGGAIDAGSRTPADEEVHTDLIAAGLVSTSVVPLTAVPGSRQVNIRPHAVLRTAAGGVRIVREALATIAHETAHSMPLGDEYAVASKLTLTPDQVDFVRLMPNLQDELDLLAPATGLIMGDLVKWRWPRLVAAGRVTDPLIPQGGGLFSVVLARGHGRSFFSGDTVHLRKPLPGGSGRAALSGPLELVVQIDDTSFVEDTSGTLNPADFPAGSVLCVPAPARPSAVAAGDTHAELLDQVIRAHLNDHHTPLNRRPASSPRPCALDERRTQPPRSLPAGLPKGRPRLRSGIIGLYDGGGEFGCGVFHPTGRCLMRTAEPTKNGSIDAFCHVCQYAIVDRFDASRHDALGKLINQQDAQP
jgi:hypothetical protein